jgi:hypothetical protein
VSEQLASLWHGGLFDAECEVGALKGSLVVAHA